MRERKIPPAPSKARENSILPIRCLFSHISIDDEIRYEYLQPGFPSVRVKLFLALAVCLSSTSLFAEETGIKINFHGQGWVDVGRIMHSPDSVPVDAGTGQNLNGNWLRSPGAQFTMVADFSENLEGAFGFGAYKTSHAMGKENGSTRPMYYTISLFQTFLTKASLTYSQGEKPNPWLSLTAGTFSHNYNGQVKNLGHYLLRGPVYPGVLMGEFQDRNIDSTKSNVMGARLHHGLGSFSQDLILMNEKDLPPTFDWSLAYIAKYKVLDAFELGAGVNFYRLMPYSSKLETPGHLVTDNGRSIEVLAPGDTLFYTHQGIKLMGMFNLDLKRVFGAGSMGPNDLILYGEAAVLGTKNYGTIYDKIGERIPIMAGFNFPAFGFLNYLSLEVEYYRSPYRNDLANIGNLNNVADWTDLIPSRPTPSPVPVQGIYPDSTRDNWKWSVNMEKIVAGHVHFIAQVANDHFRPRPMATTSISSKGGTAEAFTSPKDWYLMFRMGYFF